MNTTVQEGRITETCGITGLSLWQTFILPTAAGIRVHLLHRLSLQIMPPLPALTGGKYGVQHVHVEPDSEERPRSDCMGSMGANGEGASDGEGVEEV